MLKFIRERANDYNGNNFINELSEASKQLGILEAKIDSYQFDSILIPMLQKKEVISSMYIEGTETTITDVLKDEMTETSTQDKIMREVRNHSQALVYGAEYLKGNKFTHNFIKKLHAIMMNGVMKDESTIGKYKTKDNIITNSVGTVVYTPPEASHTKKYMDEIIDYMNDFEDGTNPLIKAAIIHSQFESIHPFSDGNGRVGRLLVSLYLLKANILNFPFFYISEAISMDKLVYYNMLTDSRNNSFDEWIKYFLRKVNIQTQKYIGYIGALNTLYQRTRFVVKESINTPKYEEIIECIFTKPIVNANVFEDELTISRGQAIRYLNVLEELGVLHGDDRKRGRTFYFLELLELARGF